MTWPTWETARQSLAQRMQQHDQAIQPLPGIHPNNTLDVLATQLIASLRREAYFNSIQRRGPIAANRANPHHPYFEAEVAVVHLLQQGQIDEAAWLVFLMTYFGKPYPEGWELLRQVYGKLGTGSWNWAAISANPAGFASWQNANWQQLTGKYGSHRKYESNRPNANRPLAGAIQQYVNLVAPHGGHAGWFAALVRSGGNDPHRIFDAAYKAVNIRGFGRLGRFDYVAMLGRYGLLPADAGSAYLAGATGPRRGAALLFIGNVNAGTDAALLQQKLDTLDADIQVGMKVLEDALCNWQKSPTVFVHFRG